MQLKDYYKILELPPSADPDEIKKAYRRLAMIYHPDKNSNDKYAALQFAAIKEAYETLVHPARKQEYLQQRWYAQSTGTFKPEELLSPFSILQRILFIERKLSYSDAYRLNYNNIENELHSVFNAEGITTLNHFNETSINDDIIRVCITCMRFLPYKKTDRLIKKLEQVQASTNARRALIKFISRQRKDHQWERSRYLLLLLLTVILCGLIFLFAN